MRMPLHFFGEGSDVGVPGEVLVEHHTKVLTVGLSRTASSAEPNGNGA